MSDFLTITLTVSDAVATQTDFSTPLILDEFEYTDNATLPLVAGKYFTDDGLVSGNPVRTMEFTSLADVATYFRATSAIYLAASAIFSQDIVPASVIVGQARAADTARGTSLNAIIDENPNWFILVDVDSDNTSVEITANAVWAEANNRVYIFQTSDSDVKGSGSSDIVSVLGAANYHNTEAIFNPVAGTYADAALASRWGATQPGSETQKFMTLNGITAVDSTTLGVARLTTTNITNLKGKYCNIQQESKVGDIVAEGTAVSGRFIDVQRYGYYLKDQLESEISLVLKNPANGDKIPYTDEGGNQLEAAIKTILDIELAGGRLASYVKKDTRGANNTIPYEIIIPKVADISTANKNLRIFKTITVKVRYSSAIHKVEVDVDMAV